MDNRARIVENPALVWTFVPPSVQDPHGQGGRRGAVSGSRWTTFRVITRLSHAASPVPDGRSTVPGDRSTGIRSAALKAIHG